MDGWMDAFCPSTTKVPQAEEMQPPVKLPPLSVPAEGRLHLLPFLIPTTICDADHTAVMDAARSLVPAGIVSLYQW